MSCNSLMYTVNSALTTVAANGAVPVGNITRRFGQAIRLNGNTGFALLATGYYLVSVNLTVDPAAATAISAGIYQNDAPVAGGTATVTPTAADAATQITIANIPVRVNCCGFKTITVKLDSEADVENAAFTIEKV